MAKQAGFDGRISRCAITAISFDRLAGCHSLPSSLPVTIAMVADGVEDGLCDID
jgi:hypothetical protein